MCQPISGFFLVMQCLCTSPPYLFSIPHIYCGTPNQYYFRKYCLYQVMDSSTAVRIVRLNATWIHIGMASTDFSYFPLRSNLSGTSTTNFSCFVLKVEAADILTDWADFASWWSRICTLCESQAIWVVPSGYENHGMMILENRLSKDILQIFTERAVKAPRLCK